MAFDPSAAEGVVKRHPITAALGGLAIVLVIWWALARGGSAPAAAPAVANDDSSTQAATAIQNAQIAAGVANNQTAAQQTVALAQIQGATDAIVSTNTANTTQAYYGAATSIANSNNSTAVALRQADDGLAEQTNSTVAGEFTTLSGILSKLLGTASSTSGPAGQTSTYTGPVGNVQDYDVVQGLLGALGSQSNVINAIGAGAPAATPVNLSWNANGSETATNQAGNTVSGSTFGNLAASNLAALSNTGPDAHA